MSLQFKFNNNDVAFPKILVWKLNQLLKSVIIALNRIYTAGVGIFIDKDNQVSVNTGDGLIIKDNQVCVDVNNIVYSSVTYYELTKLIETNKLIPGRQYRIIDYVTTVFDDPEARSAEHPFDLIVVADTVNTLNCKARAVQHEGDTYFANSDLSKWEIWYDVNPQRNDDSCKYSWCKYSGRFDEISVNNDHWDEEVGWFGYSGEVTIDNVKYYLWYNSRFSDGNGSNGYVASTKLNNFEAYEVVYAVKYTGGVAKITDIHDTQILGDFNSSTELIPFYCNDLYFEYCGKVKINDNEYRLFHNTHVEDGYKVKNIFTTSENLREVLIEKDYSTSPTSEIVNFGNNWIESRDYQCELFHYGQKGVIYRMIDEFGNDCPYDFKNIQFKRYRNVYDNTTESAFSQYRYWLAGDDYSSDLPSYGVLYIWNYTFHDCINNIDASLNYHSPGMGADNDYKGTCHNNKIEPYITTEIWDDKAQNIQNLNNNTLLFRYYPADENIYDQDVPPLYGNVFGKNCYNNIIGFGSSNNCFGNNSNYNILQDKCNSNKIGDRCQNIVLGFGSNYNSFDTESRDCLLGIESEGNTFGVSCINITLNDRCCYNWFKSLIQNCELGMFCCYNTIGNEITSIKMGNNCDFNLFDDGCSDNTLTNYCSGNTFGFNCSNNTLQSEVQNCIFDKGVEFIKISGYTTTPIKNIRVLSEVKGSQNELLELTGLSVNKTYTQTVGYEVIEETTTVTNSDGTQTTTKTGNETLKLVIKKGMNVLNISS